MEQWALLAPAVTNEQLLRFYRVLPSFRKRNVENDTVVAMVVLLCSATILRTFLRPTGFFPS